MADDSLKELSREARDVTRALKQMGDAADDAKAPLQGVGGAAEQSSRSTQVLTHALGELAAKGFSNAIDAAMRFGPALVEAAAGSERHQMALQQLGEAHALVQQATNGTVSAEQAAAVQQRALQSGLRLSAQELAAVTARARDFARSTGTDINQALEQLTDQLINPGEELSKFGIRLQQGMEAGDQLREALRQLGEQAGQTGVAQASLSESMEMATRAQREATDALAGFIAQKANLADFFTSFAEFLTQATNSANSFGTVIEGVVGTLAEMGTSIGLRSTAMAAQNQSASGAFIEQAGAVATRLRRGRTVAGQQVAGFDLGGLDLGRLGVMATPEQRTRLLEALQAAERGAVGVSPQETLSFAGGRGVSRQQALQLQLQALSHEIEVDSKRRTADSQNEARKEAIRRAAEIGRRNRVSGGGGGGGARPAAAVEMPTVFSPEVEALFVEAERAGRQRPLEELMAEADQQAATQRRAVEEFRAQSREALGGRLGGLDLAARGQAAERALVEARGGTVDRGQLATQLRERQQALQGLLDENQELTRAQTQGGATARELNDLLTQRIGIQTALAETTRSLTEEQHRLTQSQQFVLDKSVEVAGFLGGAFTDAIFAAMDAQEGAGASFAQVMEDQTRAFLRSLVKQSAVEALKETALGFGALAMGNPGAALHFKSAGLHAAVGVAAGIGAAAMGPQPNRAGASAAPAASVGGASPSARVDDRQTGGGGPLTLVVNVSGAAFTDAGVQAAVSQSLREAIGTGAIRREHLNGLLGG